MTLSDIRDYIETLTQGTVYVGPIPDKPEKIVGVYNSKHQHEYKVAIGGPQLESYGTKYVTLLAHWNKSQRETEKAGKALFEAVRATRNATVNDETIKFILPVYDLQDIGVDDSGIYEMVIELAVIFEKKGNKDEEKNCDEPSAVRRFQVWRISMLREPVPDRHSSIRRHCFTEKYCRLCNLFRIF